MRRTQGWVGYLVAVSAVLLLIGRLSAQAPGQQPPSGPPTTSPPPSQGSAPLTAPAVVADDVGQQLIGGPDGGVFRLWRRQADIRAGGGGALLALATGDTWKTLLELIPSEPGVTALEPDVALGSSKDIALVYQWRINNPRAKQVRLARSSDGGQTWTRPITPIESSGKGFEPKVAWGRGGSLLVAWSDERRAERAWDVYARRSPDGGVTWEPEQKLSRFPRQKPSDLAVRPEIVTDGQNRYWIVWMGLVNDRSRFYLSRSVDDGRTWTDPVVVSGQSESVFAQRLLRSGEHLLLVWQDSRTGKDRIYAATSSDSGITWTDPTQVDHVPANSQFFAGVPTAVLAPDGEAFVAWADGRNGRDDIFIARSIDWGRTWGKEDTRLDADDPGTAASRFPKVARAQDGRIAVVWEDDRNGNEGIYLRLRGVGASATWDSELVVTLNGGPKAAAHIPSVLWAQGGLLYVSWDVWPSSGQGSKYVTGRPLNPDKK